MTLAAARVPLAQTVATIALWLAIWMVPLLAVAALFGSDHVLAKLAWFFSKLAVVTFGGAYAVLAYMAQDVVQLHGWLKPGEMLDGLGLAETTPGPLILVTEFVGYLAAYRAGGGSSLGMGEASTTSRRGLALGRDQGMVRISAVPSSLAIASGRWSFRTRVSG